ncbi:MAG: B12-binding domain-containing radical SAM protein [Candidatus Omnitrophica bacterium]|nr:B12-binding domain-containing radical SAM protein [Candidatus Omnitrophota bacterium]
MAKKIFLIRAHKDLNAGGAVPPLGLLYIASSIIRSFKDLYDIKIFNTGLNGVSVGSLSDEFKRCQPDLLGISAMTCEAGLMNELARAAKAVNNDIVIIAGGPHAALAGAGILENRDIDFVIAGEGEEAIAGLLTALDKGSGFSDIPGLSYRSAGKAVSNAFRRHPQDLDKFNILPEAWDLIDLKCYSGYPNWNGARKNKYYAPIFTSRGCPFKCFFCRSRDTFGNEFRARSAGDVIDEIVFLKEKFGIKELHVYDDVFNYDPVRAKAICRGIIEKKLGLAIAFPNGLRADMVDDEMLDLFRLAGVYKINYGIESVSRRVQKSLGKDLDLAKVENTINKTVKSGIITTGYFIFGFPGESREDILETIYFAANSALDNAYFFKFTDFSSLNARASRGEGGLEQSHFHSPESLPGMIPVAELNGLILKAQQHFYGDPRRICRGFLRSPGKGAFVKNLLNALSLLILSYIVMKLAKPQQERAADKGQKL